MVPQRSVVEYMFDIIYRICKHDGSAEGLCEISD